MSGFKTKIFYSTTTGATTEDGFKKSDEIAEQIADFILTLLPSGYTKETVEQTYTKSDVTYNYKGFQIGKEGSDIKWKLNCNSNSTIPSYKVFIDMKTLSKDSNISSKSVGFQTSSAVASVGCIKMSYVVGANGSVAIQFSDYNGKSHYNGNFDFLFAPATIPNTSDTAEFMMLTNSGTDTMYSASNDVLAYKDVVSSNIDTEVLSFSGGNYDFIVPMPVPNTKYLSDDLYICTNSDGTPNKVIEYNGGKYALITTYKTAIAMRIE